MLLVFHHATKLVATIKSHVRQHCKHGGREGHVFANRIAPSIASEDEITQAHKSLKIFFVPMMGTEGKEGERGERRLISSDGGEGQPLKADGTVRYIYKG